jgi:hypothetical protein
MHSPLKRENEVRVLGVPPFIRMQRRYPLLKSPLRAATVTPKGDRQKRAIENTVPTAAVGPRRVSSPGPLGSGPRLRTAHDAEPVCQHRRAHRVFSGSARLSLKLRSLLRKVTQGSGSRKASLADMRRKRLYGDPQGSTASRKGPAGPPPEGGKAASDRIAQVAPGGLERQNDSCRHHLLFGASRGARTGTKPMNGGNAPVCWPWFNPGIIGMGSAALRSLISWTAASRGRPDSPLALAAYASARSRDRG